jgi:hypothetical protein
MGFLAGLGDLLGGLFGAGGILSNITGILGAVTGVMSIVNAFDPPKVNMPNFQMPNAYQQATSQSLVPQVPTDLLNQLQQNITNNQQISDAARQTATQALADYNAGKLSPQYQSMLDNWYNKQRTAILQQFQGEGQGNSTELTSALNQLDQQYQAQAANYLQTQLTNAMNAAGLTRQQATDIMNAANTTSGINAQQNATILAGDAGYAHMQQLNDYNTMLGTQLSNQMAAGQANSLAGMGNTLGKIDTSINSSTWNPPATLDENWWSDTNYSDFK